jgi:hypothetical protein
MSFPSSPTNGATTTINGTTYTYNSTLGTWTATSTGSANTTGNITAGNVTVNNALTVNGAATTGLGAVYAGSAGATHLYSTSQFISNTNAYSQMALQNLNNGNAASTDIALYNDQGTDTSYFIDMGILSSNYDVTAGWTMGAPNDGYLYVAGSNETGPFSTGSNVGNLTIGSVSGYVKVFSGGTLAANVIHQTSNTSLSVLVTTPATSSTTGALTVAGGAGVAGNLYVGGNLVVGNSISYPNLTVTNNLSTVNLTVSGNTTVSGNLSAANINATTSLTANGAPVATTGKAIAMAMVFGG